MKTLTRFETDLNRILRCLLGRAPLAEGLPLLVREVKAPTCLSRDCVELVQDTLAKGCTQRLAQFGWSSERYLVDGLPVQGRLWQRRPPQQLALRFTENTLRLLMWLTSQNFITSKSMMRVSSSRMTPADFLFSLIAFNSLKDTLGAPHLLRREAFWANPLMWLLFPHRFADSAKAECDVDFAPWFEPDASWMLEALQRTVADSWAAVEQSKSQTGDVQALRRLGQIQADVLQRYLDAADAAGRRDLSRFLLDAVAAVVKASSPGRPWLTTLRLDALRLAERGEIYQAALTVLTSVERLRGWQQEALGISFYDEDYQAGQMWKAEWEARDGDDICRQARELVQSVAPLKLGSRRMENE